MPFIRPARYPDDADAVLSIFREFVASPRTDLSYQNNEADFATLPGGYAPPSGGILLAEQDGSVVGCVAFRRVSATICEMKRLYVRPEARGSGLGRELVARLLEQARLAGYEEVRLDVLAEFNHAQRLYEELGFTQAEPVSQNPTPGAKYFGLRLLDPLS